MMQISPIMANTAAPIYWQAEVQGKTESGFYDLENGTRARCAVSCVVAPEAGDQAVCYSDESSGEMQTYILAILTRKSVDKGSKGAPRTARLTVPECDQMRLVQSSIQCHARDKVEIGCLNHIRLTSARGNVEVSAQNLIHTLVGSIVESSKERICNAGFIQFCASFLTRIHSNQAIVTADADIKIDAERVNLG